MITLEQGQSSRGMHMKRPEKPVWESLVGRIMDRDEASVFEQTRETAETLGS